MDAKDFVTELDETLRTVLAVRDSALQTITDSLDRADMPLLLKGALRNEMEASEIAARWMAVTPEIEARLAFARQAGDEAKHYQLIAERLGQMGVDLSGFDPLAGGHSRLFFYLDSLETTVERVAAAEFAREAIGYKANELFIGFCDAYGDSATAEMYRKRIQPDERHHHEWGKSLLTRLAIGPREQAAASKAVLRTLDLAEELRSLAAGRLLVELVPGC
jgi:1,2-phenylacetyl-CoA epoxidase catalytic subunit